MGHRLDTSLYDGLTADPGAPENGEVWHRSDLGELRARLAGVTEVIAPNAGSLQGAYDGSGPAPLITLTGAVGAFTIEDNAAPLGGTLFGVRDNGGVNVLDVRLVGTTIRGNIPTTAGLATPFAAYRDAGNAVAGDGVSIDWDLSSSTGVRRTALRFSSEWSVATNGSETSEAVFSARVSGVFVEALRFANVGFNTAIRAPLGLVLQPNGDPDDGLLLTTVANDTFVLPLNPTRGFFFGNTLADPSVDLDRSTARCFALIPLGTTITTALPGEWVNFGSDIVLDHGGGTSIGGLVSATGRFLFRQAGGVLGAGNLFKNAATFKNDSGFGVSFGSQYTFVNTAIYQADGAAISSLFWRNGLFQTTWNTVAGGTLAITTVNQGGYINPNVQASVTLTNMRDWEWGLGTFAGTVTNRSHLYFSAGNTPAATIFSGIQSLIVASPNHLFIRHTGTADAEFGGGIGLGAGATVDWRISRLAANVATLDDGDSLRISTGSLFMGAAGTVRLDSLVANRLDLSTGDSFRIVAGSLEFGADVSLTRGAADRLDLASGDDLRLVAGALQFAGTAEQISRSAGELLLTAAVIRTTAELDIGGDLNHDGSNVGLYGTAPAAQSAAYTRNATIVEDRTLLASASATILNNNNVLAALIADLQSRGFIG